MGYLFTFTKKTTYHLQPDPGSCKKQEIQISHITFSFGLQEDSIVFYTNVRRAFAFSMALRVGLFQGDNILQPGSSGGHDG